MTFTLEFLRIFGVGMAYVSPLVIFLIILILLFGRLVGRKEGWSRSDSVYYAFITATTVGYGDFRPATKFGKFASIAIALIGLLMTGIIVAIGLEAATQAFKILHGIPAIR